MQVCKDCVFCPVPLVVCINDGMFVTAVVNSVVSQCPTYLD